MKYCLVFITILTLLPSPSFSAELKAKFIGNESFIFTDGTETIVSDFPYQSGYSLYMPYEWDQDLPQNTISLITHNHRDHFAEELFKDLKWKIIGPKDTTKNVSPERIIPIEDEITIGPIKITPIRTPHARLEHYNYLVNWDGIKLYFVGDTESYRALRDRNEELDYLFTTPWFYKRALRDNLDLKAKHIIFYHHTLTENTTTCGSCYTPKQGEEIVLKK